MPVASGSLVNTGGVKDETKVDNKIDFIGPDGVKEAMNSEPVQKFADVLVKAEDDLRSGGKDVVNHLGEAAGTAAKSGLVGATGNAVKDVVAASGQAYAAKQEGDANAERIRHKDEREEVQAGLEQQLGRVNLETRQLEHATADVPRVESLIERRATEGMELLEAEIASALVEGGPQSQVYVAVVGDGSSLQAAARRKLEGPTGLLRRLATSWPNRIKTLATAGVVASAVYGSQDLTRVIEAHEDHYIDTFAERGIWWLSIFRALGASTGCLREILQDDHPSLSPALVNAFLELSHHPLPRTFTIILCLTERAGTPRTVFHLGMLKTPMSMTLGLDMSKLAGRFKDQDATFKATRHPLIIPSLRIIGIEEQARPLVSVRPEGLNGKDRGIGSFVISAMQGFNSLPAPEPLADRRREFIKADNVTDGRGHLISIHRTQEKLVPTWWWPGPRAGYGWFEIHAKDCFTTGIGFQAEPGKPHFWPRTGEKIDDLVPAAQA